MKKIILSITSIVFAAAIIIGGTNATLNSRNTSSGNTFAMGIIDLKIDNESYVTNEDGVLVYNPTTSWQLAPLTGKLFFNFPDVKPGDIGEDTISLHVNNNNAWACMNVKLTGIPGNDTNEPEEIAELVDGTEDGELQRHLYFVYWADDGDNVFETQENIFKKGFVQDIWSGDSWALADSDTNVWGGNGPLLGNTVKYIGKAWCVGDMTQTPVAQDGLGKTGANGPLVRGTGFSCDGEDVGNIIQSDGVNVDVSFYVAQSRNNSGFQCGEGDHDNDKDNKNKKDKKDKNRR